MTERRLFCGTYFRAKDDTIPVGEFSNVTWREIASAFCQSIPALSKESVALVGPYKLRVPARANENVEYVSFAVLDLDKKGGTKDSPIYFTFDDVCEMVSEYDCDAVVASTFSNGGPDKFKCRIFIPLSRDVLASEWPAVWEALNQKYAKGLADPQCKAVCSQYYLPSHQDGGAAPPVSYAHFIDEAGGTDTYCDVEHTLAHYGSRHGSKAAETTPTQASLKWLRRVWQQTKRKGLPLEALSKLINGEPYAEVGERDNVAFALCRNFVETWPDLNVEETAKLFLPSTALMGHDAPDKANIEGKLKRAKQNRVDRVTERIQRCFGNERTHPYTSEELHACADRLNTSYLGLKTRWVIQRGRSFYVLVILDEKRHEYRIRDKDEIQTAALIDLAPAISAAVDPEVTNERGTKPKTHTELCRDYGSIAERTIVDLSAQFPHYNPETRVFTEAPCPIRVQPVRHPRVEEFFAAFAGLKHDQFLLWCAALPLVSHPLAALYIEGDSNVGKSLLGRAFSRIWTPDGPNSLTDQFKDFHDSLVRCPYLFADEVVPSGGLRQQGNFTSSMRELIQAPQRPLERKFKPSSIMVGSVRICMAANNRGLLYVMEQLTPADVDAFSERFLHIVVMSDNPKEWHVARRFLASLPNGEMDEWLRGDTIAEHVLWLHQNTPLDAYLRNRFIIPASRDRQNDLAMHVATSAGWNSAVCSWLVAWLRHPAALAPMEGGRRFVFVVRDRDGRPMLLAKADGIQEHWTAYVKHDRTPPTVTQVSRALGTLSLRRRGWREGDRDMKIREVDLEKLYYWASENNIATRAELEAALAVHVSDWERGVATGAFKGTLSD